MPIRIEQPGLAGLYGKAAVISKGEAEARKRQEQQAEFEYRTSLRQQDMAIDLQMNERAKMWQIEKMEIASRMDFQREEQQRQKKLDGYDNIDAALDKEIQSGKMTEEEAQPYRLKNNLAREGMNVSISDITRQQDEERYGVRPYWMRGKEAPEGTPERQLYEAKMEQQISGERPGTIPYYFDPSFISKYPEAARQAQEARGIFLEDEEFNALMSAPTAVESVEENRVRVVSPTGQTGTILKSELPEYIDKGFEVIDATPETTPGVVPDTPETVLPETTEDIVKQLEAGEAKFRKPSLRTFATMSPLRYLMERRKAKKLVR